ncbi:MAG: hypothetical protein M3R55_17530 [Acidobacteriota bacterium]|nr:hypothetical protein [Acidobacteriota bacterium]
MMTTRRSRAVADAARVAGVLLLLLSPSFPPAPTPLHAQVRETDLDALMARALKHRADAWKTMEQYILNEREQVELRGPLGIPLFGERRDFTWFVRDGYFVRSPLEFNGVKIGDEKRRQYEERWMAREKEREKRDAEKKAKQDPAGTAAPAAPAAPPDVDGFIKQTAEPRFISAAYFLNFKFEPGNYYMAGRETFEGRPVVRVEYFPRKLFVDSDEDAERKKAREAQRVKEGKGKEKEVSFDFQMNKVARITLWVDEERAMILKYVFENVDLAFMPAQWLVRVEDVRAEMAMAQPFPGIWLPKDMGMQFGVTFANGTYGLRYRLSFYDYRMGDVKSRIKFDGRQP